MGNEGKKEKGKTKKTKRDRPVVKIKSSSYQPSKAELHADVSIPTTPEHLAKCITRTVNVQESEDA